MASVRFVSTARTSLNGESSASPNIEQASGSGLQATADNFGTHESENVDEEDVSNVYSDSDSIDDPLDPDYKMRESEASDYESDLESNDAHDDLGDLLMSSHDRTTKDKSLMQISSSGVKHGLGFDSDDDPEDEFDEIKKEYAKFVSTKFKLGNVWSWFEENKKDFPNVYLLAKEYLIIPASSAASERLFSKAGNIITKKRNRLLPETSQELIFLSSNANELRELYSTTG